MKSMMLRPRHTGLRRPNVAHKAFNFGDLGMVVAPPLEVGYSNFIMDVAENKIANVHISNTRRELYADLVDGGRQHVLFAGSPAPLTEALTEKGVPFDFYDDWTSSMPLMAIEFAALIILGRMILNGIGGGPGGMAGRFGASPAKELKEEENTGVTFGDIAGAENAKHDLMEIVDFLKAPERYAKVGAKIPRGVLLVGPPGTGKTLLARAVAGEAGVPFFPCSGSEFIEMFVGVGASRVRQLFQKAMEKAPSIIFIDEIDAIGKQRGTNMMGGGNDERDQTINQLLTAMDGFKGNTGVIVIAATNRPDILDDALLRPGRFDRRVSVDLPDLTGRLGILGIHTRGKPLASDVDIQGIGRVTVGFSGADLESLCNEAAIYAARGHRDVITADDFDKALEKLTMGEERRTLLVTEEKKKLIAYHEAGHALLGLAFQDKGFDKVRKISIVPRGGAGGATYFEPDENHVDLSLVTREYLEQQIMVTLGGRIAEEIVFGEEKTTTGASGDFQMVHELAYSMITEYGFSDLGPVYLGDADGLSQDISQEVLGLVNEMYMRAYAIVELNRTLLDDIANTLLIKETLIADDVQVFAEKVVVPQGPWTKP